MIELASITIKDKQHNRLFRCNCRLARKLLHSQVEAIEMINPTAEAKSVTFIQRQPSSDCYSWQLVLTLGNDGTRHTRSTGTNIPVACPSVPIRPENNSGSAFCFCTFTTAQKTPAFQSHCFQETKCVLRHAAIATPHSDHHTKFGNRAEMPQTHN